jgi:iron complex outermembrane receptor protein
MMGRLLKPGQVRKPARQNQAFKAFGKKSAGSFNDSPSYSSDALELMVVIDINAAIIQTVMEMNLILKAGISLRTLALYIALILSLTASGQRLFLNDTIRINEIVVRGSLLSSASDGYKLIKVDSAVLKEYNLGNLSEIISDNTPVFIKSYGLGGAATTSLRGTGASHTQLAWNGINIISPMLGQADISLIPAGFLDDITIYSGGASMSLNCGGLGGIINIETKPDWKNGSSLLVNPGIGSFGRYNGMIKARTGSKIFQTVTKAYIQSAENNFRFLNDVNTADPFYEHRRNSQVNQVDIMQELYLRGRNSVTSARVWYQVADRNLPSSMLVQQTGEGESQFDKSLRTMLNYNHYNSSTDYEISVSWFSDRLNYLNPVASIDSRNHSNTLIAKGGLETILGDKTRLRFIFNNELNYVKSVNYTNQKTRNVSTVTASLRREFSKNTGAVLLVRQILSDNHLLIPDFSSAMDIKPIDSREYFLKFSFSRNSKVPTLNDMYWNPGGNPDLKNEYSYTGEMSWEMKGNILPALKYNTELTLFSNNIKDMIQWSPSQFSYWSPSNISNVKTSGVEAGLNLIFKSNNFTGKFNSQYTLTNAHLNKSGDVSFISDKQLEYVPQNQINAGIRLSYKSFYSSWITCFNSKRFLTADNSEYLPDYTLNSFIAGLRIISNMNSFDLCFKIDNVLSINYQAIAYYPMPGRSFIFSITYQLTKRQ